jgi:small subunit ribosomal protein S8
MLTRIRNAHGAGMDMVEMPSSRMKAELARVLKREGFVADYVVEGGAKKTLRVYLKYTPAHEPAITGIRRESRPGLRRYTGVAQIPRVLGGMGVAILSTPSGIMSGKEARRKRVGGEWLCSVW